jgi:hypothetical protein
MKLILEPYLNQVEKLPKSGRHILAQYDSESVVVYQAYRPEIGNFAIKYGYFGGEFSFNRMSWSDYSRGVNPHRFLTSRLELPALRHLSKTCWYKRQNASHHWFPDSTT